MTATLTPAVQPGAPGVDRPSRVRRALARARRHRDALLLFGALPFVLAGIARATTFAEGDTYWQITTGAEVLARRTTSLVENDSWDAAGTPWHPNSWLYDVLVERAWVLGGWTALGLFTVLTVGAVGIAATVVGRRLGALTPELTVVATVALVPVIPWLSARPQSLSYAAAVLVVGLSWSVLGGTGRRSLVLGAPALAALTALWVNVHLAALSGLAAVGGGVAVAVAVGPLRDVVRARSSWTAALTRLGRPLVVLVAVGLGCLASPLGTGIVAAAGHTAGASVEIIDEWAPLWRAKPMLVLTWVAAAAALAALLGAWRRSAGQGGTPVWLPFWVGAVAVLVAGGVTAARFSPMALLVAVPAVAAVLPVVRPARTPWLVSRLAVTLPVAVGAAVLGVALANAADFGRPGPLFPTEATIAAIPDGCRVLNEYDDGGLLTLLRGADGVLISADGRNDVYGVATLMGTERLMRGADGALDTLADEGVDCLLLMPDRPLVAQAVAAGWQLTAQDANRVLLVRP
ncbi:hypothetical protein SAMN05660199_00141 [Klenkia soli]|uniref:Dolichyl-phosphate-mannose-protein mannosyltransferase n=1 Tax=Klenkia soli TaxID=1052260 RepID=A0A1H0BX95_9ACTN|nr:hypothetical protein [Klenkia soli]SDN50100.1 hypothetical protein SAMN05660199_00141 [Klenkia soli]